MKLKTIPVKKSIIESLPYNFKKELTGYIDEEGIHFIEGTKLHCPSYPDKKIVFHTHVDVRPEAHVITMPDLPSPVDMLVFMLIGNNIMYIKTSRVVITLRKTRKSKSVELKMLRCILENEKYWKNLSRQGKNEHMFFFMVHYLKRNIDKKNKVWNLSWKKIIEQIFKVNVIIETSNVKDPL